MFVWRAQARKKGNGREYFFKKFSAFENFYNFASPNSPVLLEIPP